MEAHHLSLCSIRSSHSEHPCGLCDYSLMKQPTRSHVSRTEPERVLRSRCRSNSGSDLRVWSAPLWSCRLYGWFRRGCGPMGSEFLFSAHREQHTVSMQGDRNKKIYRRRINTRRVVAKGFKDERTQQGFAFPWTALKKSWRRTWYWTIFCLFTSTSLGRC